MIDSSTILGGLVEDSGGEQYAKHFADMAERIRRIDPAEFAGAIVVVPPGDGETIAFLTTDPIPDTMQFWSTVKSRIEVHSGKVVEQAAAQRERWR